jgi:hypothetical protein
VKLKKIVKLKNKSKNTTNEKIKNIFEGFIDSNECMELKKINKYENTKNI